MKVWSPGLTLADVERTAIAEAYSFHSQNKTKTAESLGISIRTLDKRLEEIDKQKTQPGPHVTTPGRENNHAEFAHGGLRSPFYPYAEGHAPKDTMKAEKVLNKPEEAFSDKKPNGRAQTVKLTHAPKKKK